MISLLIRGSLNVQDTFTAEKFALNLSERQSTATITVGPEAPVIGVGDWLRDNDYPGNGIVWRVKSVDEDFASNTRTINCDHMINSLRDRIMWGEVTPATITGNKKAEDCTAVQAVRYILKQQHDWVLGTLGYTKSAPYNFNGDDLFSALETVSSSLLDAWWSYDFSVYPFVLTIGKKESAITCEMRMDRNIRTLKKTIDRSRMFTRFYPIGKNNLKLSDKYVSKNEDLYGVIAKVETDNSKDSKKKLTNWANERLNNHAEPQVTVTISGLELSASTGEPLDRLTLGRVCRVPLPEFSTTITERITKLSWADKIADPESVTITLANEYYDLASILNNIQQASSSGGRSTAKNNEEDHAWFVDTTTHVAMVAEAVAGPGAAENWSRVSSVVVDGMGIHQRVVRTEGEIVTMWATIDVLDDMIKLEVANAKSDTYSKIEQTASSIRTEVNASKSTLFSTIMQTATNIYTQVGNAKSDTYSKIEQTASSIESTVSSAKSSLWSGIMQTSTQISLKVSKDGVISSINQTAETIAIDASKVSISGTMRINNVFTVINGAVGVSVPLICSGNIDIASNKVLNLYTATFQGTNPVTLNAITLAHVIKSASVSGNTLTLTPMLGDAITFSKAVTLSGEWGSGHLEVTASPQGTKYNQYIIAGSNEDQSGNTWYVPILAKDSASASTSKRTGLRVYVNASARYNAGYSDAAGNMGWPATISGQTTKSSVDITYPTSSGGTSTRTLTLTRDTGGAYVKLGSSLILRIT